MMSRAVLTNIVSLLVGAACFLVILLLSTALMGKAQSQEPQDMAPLPQAEIQEPSFDLPPEFLNNPVESAEPQVIQEQVDPSATPAPATSPDAALNAEAAPNLPAATEAIVPEIVAADGFLYDPKGRRDPFQPFGVRASTPSAGQSIPVGQIPGGPQLPAGSGEQQAAPSPAIDLEPLQTFDISQLKVVGIMWEITNPRAMIQDPVGKTHLIRKDTKIGRNRGFVAAIREGEIVIVEPAVIEGLNTATTRVLSLTR